MSPPDAAFRVYSTNFFTLPEDFVLSWRIEGVKLFDIMTATVSMSATMLTATAAGSLPALRDNDIIAGLLILLLGIALGIGISCLLVVRRGREPARRPLRRHDLPHPERRYTSAILNVPSRWLAIKSGNPQLVQAALGLHNPTPCSWEEGLTVSHEQKLFISPPVGGWILVMGSNLPEPGEDVDKCYRFVLELSRKLGQVQYFSISRAVNHHTWVLAEEGAVGRAYSWAGKVIWNQGRMTRPEMDLGLKCYDYGEGEDRIDFGKVDPAAVNTERVPLLASRWSLDPTSIDARMLKETQGISGQLSRTKAH